MKVYVESNFVLELALEQEERASCERLVEPFAELELRPADGHRRTHGGVAA